MEEKKIAFNEILRSSSLFSEKICSASSSYENALTIFSLPTISSMIVVCCPRVSDCLRNRLEVFFAIKAATNKDNGVSTITTSATHLWIASIKKSVPTIVSIPVKNCVNPISRPSAKVSTSAMMRLTVSPVGCLSR